MVRLSASLSLVNTRCPLHLRLVHSLLPITATTPRRRCFATPRPSSHTSTVSAPAPAAGPGVLVTSVVSPSGRARCTRDRRYCEARSADRGLDRKNYREKRRSTHVMTQGSRRPISSGGNSSTAGVRLLRMRYTATTTSSMSRNCQRGGSAVKSISQRYCLPFGRVIMRLEGLFSVLFRQKQRRNTYLSSKIPPLYLILPFVFHTACGSSFVLSDTYPQCTDASREPSTRVMWRGCGRRQHCLLACCRCQRTTSLLRIVAPVRYASEEIDLRMVSGREAYVRAPRLLGGILHVHLVQ